MAHSGTRAGNTQGEPAVPYRARKVKNAGGRRNPKTKPRNDREMSMGHRNKLKELLMRAKRGTI